VNTLLVPSDGNDELSLHAVYFALEFAKRTGARVLFLTVDRDQGMRSAVRQPLATASGVRPELERVICSGRVGGLEVETHVTDGDYVGQVAAFARDHHVSRVVMALPEPDDAAFARVEEQVTALRNRLGCVLVTVRPRKDRHGAVAEHELNRMGSRTTDGER
jgi:hypothetical protein